MKLFQRIVILIIIFSIPIAYLMLRDKHYTEAELVPFYFYPYEDHFVQTGFDSIGEIREKAMKHYRYKEYEECSREMADYLKSVPEDKLALFYYLQARMAVADFSEALIEMYNLSEDSSFALHKQAEWYYILCLMNSNQSGAIRARLDHIVSDPSHPYFSRSKDLYKQLPHPYGPLFKLFEN